ncbi:hypothetical protein TNCV_4398001 [Trichonephila clavipes]|nr:hypothetical protein TNCV_4398001 [Trichonephila clavipes]
MGIIRVHHTAKSGFGPQTGSYKGDFEDRVQPPALRSEKRSQITDDANKRCLGPYTPWLHKPSHQVQDPYGCVQQDAALRTTVHLKRGHGGNRISSLDLGCINVASRLCATLSKVRNSPKMVTNMVAKFVTVTNTVVINEANLTLSPRFRQVPIESPL